MITARNYAAQAERDLLNYAAALASRKTINGISVVDDARFIHMMAKGIGRAVHFVAPDGGTVFDDGLKGIKGTAIRLPYQEITLEYFVSRGIQSDTSDVILNPIEKRVIYAYESEKTKAIHVAAAFFYNGKWNPCLGVWLLPLDWDDFTDAKSPGFDPVVGNEHGGRITGRLGTFTPGLQKLFAAQVGETQAARMNAHDITGEVSALLEIIEALTCTNVEPAIHQAADPKVNAKRIKAGKLPIYETKVLTIKPNHVSGESRGPLGHERNSPRQHLRRGHIRRLPSGKNTWVQSCVVGSSANGFIDKAYEVDSDQKGRRGP